MKALKSKTTKIVHILARYALKHDGVLTGVVVYLVLASKGDKQYTATLVAGHATGCTCPANKPCYHMVQLEAIEQARMLHEAEQQLTREQAAAVAEAEALLSSEDDAEYEEWKRAHGFDQPMSREEYVTVNDPNGWELL